MIDREREMVETMVKAMTIEEKVVAWNVLKDDEQLNKALTQVATEDPGPPTIERLLEVAKTLTNKGGR